MNGNQEQRPDRPPERPARIELTGQAFREVFGIAGAGLAGYGAWLHYQPLGFAVGGALMVALAIVGTMKGA